MDRANDRRINLGKVNCAFWHIQRITGIESDGILHGGQCESTTASVGMWGGRLDLKIADLCTPAHCQHRLGFHARTLLACTSASSQHDAPTQQQLSCTYAVHLVVHLCFTVERALGCLLQTLQVHFSTGGL
jgi:hypothetical protein